MVPSSCAACSREINAHFSVPLIQPLMRVTDEKIGHDLFGHYFSQNAGVITMRDGGGLAGERELGEVVAADHTDVASIAGEFAAIPVIVAEDKRCRMTGKTIEHRRTTDIAAMNEVFGAKREKQSDCRRSGFCIAVSIAENSDDHRFKSIVGRAIQIRPGQ